MSALKRLEVPIYIARYISQTYEGRTSKVKCEEGEVEIKLHREVKQGLLILNAVVLPLICYLDQRVIEKIVMTGFY